MARRADRRAARSSAGSRRTFVTPEGVDLRLDIATMGERAAAFVLDLVIMLLTLVVFTILTLFLLAGTGDAARQVLAIIWLLVFFILRNAYFVIFELGPRAATPGKRMMKMRVVSRDGGRLRGHQVIARNAMRELELFLPLSFAAYQTSQGVADQLTGIFGLVWTGIFAMFPLFNRDRLRVGDLIAGTWVIRLPRRSLQRSLIVAPTVAEWSGYHFTDEQLGAYGEFELKKLEEVLRRQDDLAMIVVARAIRARLGWPPREGDEAAFLEAYYMALCQRLERNMLFGRRKRDKFQA
jgi:uncharacterized RDD family membrane protein YckC